MSGALSLSPDDREMLDRLGQLEYVERLLDFDEGPVYPHEYPPGYAEPIDGERDFDEWIGWEGPP